MESLSRPLCRSCRRRLTQTHYARTFTSSSTRNIIPPESPNYIDVPQSYQPDLLRRKPQKGLLPAIRELFPARRPDKPSYDYLAKVTADPKSSNVRPESSLTPLELYRSRMTILRKSHLRTGLVALHERKKKEVQTARARSEAKKQERQRLSTQAEREDERLTNVSTPVQMRPTSVPKLSKHQAHILLAKRRNNYKKHTLKTESESRDSLHTLYMNARWFINSESQLNAAIEKAFSEQFRSKNSNTPGKSVWNTGVPDTIGKMIARMKGIDREATTTSLNDERAKVDEERMRRIAGKLSGGKIESSDERKRIEEMIREADREGLSAMQTRDDRGVSRP